MPSPTVLLLIPDIMLMLQSRQLRDARDALRELQHADAAELIANLDPSDGAVAFRLLDREAAAEVFSEFEPDFQKAMIALLGDVRSLRVIEEMDPDDRARLLDELPIEVAKPIIRSLSDDSRQKTQVILGYPEDSVGRIMTPDYVRLRPEWTIEHSIAHIRRYGRDAETINWVYVIEPDGRLRDDIHIRAVLLADPQDTVESLMDDKFLSLNATDDREEAVRVMARYDRTAMPVIDSLGMLLGIVTIDDVTDVAEEEMTEDIQKLGGMAALDRSYMSTGFTELFKKRGGWLSGLFILQLVTIGVMAFFDEQLAKAVVLALFVPLIISSGGNTGTQAASLMVRALALDEVSLTDWSRVIAKEIGLGLALGFVLGGLGLLTVLGAAITGVVETEFAWLIAATVGVSVLGIVLWGTLIGSMLPLVLRRMGLDPAASSAPFVATIMDVTGLLIYFGVALLLLQGTVL